MKQILFIAHTMFPLFAGDALYNYGLYTAFREIADITVYSYVKDLGEAEGFIKENPQIHLFENQSDYSQKLNERANLGQVFPIDKKMFTEVCKIVENNEFDYIFVSHIVMAQFAVELKKVFPRARIVYISHDVEVKNKYDIDKFEQRNVKNPLKIARHKLWLLRRLRWHYHYEKFLLSCADFYLTISREDIKYHKKLYAKIGKGIFCKPLIEFKRSKSSESLVDFNKRLIIAGTMSWFPNVEGGIWFAEKVMPQLISEGYVLYFVGNKPAKEILDLQNKYPENIIVTGRVPSMDEYFENSDISIIPLFSGTGAKIKFLESIGRGIPTISTSFAAKDYDIDDGVVLIADDEKEFIDGIHKIANDCNLRKELYFNMKNYYEKYMVLDDEIVDLLK